MADYLLARIAGSFLAGEADDLVLTRHIASASERESLLEEMQNEAAQLDLVLVEKGRQPVSSGVELEVIAEESVLRRAAVTGARGGGLAPASLSQTERGMRWAFFRSFGFSDGLCDAVLQEAVAAREAADLQRYRAQGFFQYGAAVGEVRQGGLPDELWNHPVVIVSCAGRVQIPGYLGAPTRRHDVDAELCRVWLEHASLDTLATWVVSVEGWVFMSFARPDLQEELARIRALIPDEARSMARRRDV